MEGVKKEIRVQKLVRTLLLMNCNNVQQCSKDGAEFLLARNEYLSRSFRSFNGLNEPPSSVFSFFSEALILWFFFIKEKEQRKGAYSRTLLRLRLETGATMRGNFSMV